MTAFETMAFVWLLMEDLLYSSRDRIWVWDFTGLHFIVNSVNYELKSYIQMHMQEIQPGSILIESFREEF